MNLSDESRIVKVRDIAHLTQLLYPEGYSHQENGDIIVDLIVALNAGYNGVIARHYISSDGEEEIYHRNLVDESEGIYTSVADLVKEHCHDRALELMFPLRSIEDAMVQGRLYVDLYDMYEDGNHEYIDMALKSATKE